MRTTPRKTSLMLSIAALFIAACGGDNDTAATQPTAASTLTTETASEPTDPTTTDGSVTPGDDCRTVTHELGDACVPAEPTRIAVIDPVGALPTLLDLDAPVVAAASVFADVYPGYLTDDELAGITNIGGSFELNLELIAEARPDLIVGTLPYIGDHYDTLSALAPTVVTQDTYYNDDWTEVVLQVADLVGGRDQVQAQLDTIAADADDIGVLLAESALTPEITRMDVYQGSPYIYRQNCVWWGGLIEAAGVTQPEAQQGPCNDDAVANGYVQVAPEQLEIIDADVILVYNFQGDPTIDAVTAANDTLGTNPLWATLGAVERGDLVEVDDAWGLGAGARAAEQILADLRTYFTD